MIQYYAKNPLTTSQAHQVWYQDSSWYSISWLIGPDFCNLVTNPMWSCDARVCNRCGSSLGQIMPRSKQAIVALISYKIFIIFLISMIETCEKNPAYKYSEIFIRYKEISEMELIMSKHLSWKYQQQCNKEVQCSAIKTQANTSQYFIQHCVDWSWI